VVITPDFESGNLGSNPGKTSSIHLFMRSEDPNFLLNIYKLDNL